MIAWDIYTMSAIHALQDRGFIVVSPAEQRAGYRIIGPDELDPVTLERAAEVADRRPHASNKSIAKAIRSLKKEGGGDG